MSKIPTARSIASGEAEAQRMIEFAKLHVKAALEAVHKSMQIPEENLEFTLNAYPLTNIK